NPDAPDAKVGGPKRASGKLGCRRECQSPVEQSPVNPGRGLIGNVCDERLSDPIPVLQGAVEISLKEVEGAKKVVGVSVGRIELGGSAQKFGGLRIALLLECRAGELNRKTFVCRLLTLTVNKCGLSFLPACELSKSRTVIEVQVGRAMIS